MRYPAILAKDQVPNTMTPERAKELLPIIQAFSEGKKIECMGSPGHWNPMSYPQFDDMSHYRIAKEKKWYRVAQLISGCICCNKETTEEQWPQKEIFIRWLTPRIYYDVE